MKNAFTKTSGSVLLVLAMLPLVAKGQFTTANNGDNTVTITGYTGTGGNVVVPITINGFTVKTIGDGAFQGVASMTNLTIADSVTSIGHNAFAFCAGLIRVTIGNGVTIIMVNAFYGNSSLRNVSIGNGITTLENGAFQQCGNLSAVYFAGNAPTSVFGNVFAADPVTIYRTVGATGWSSTLASRPVDFFGLTGLAPIIAVQPNNQTVVVGNTSMVTVTARSESLLLYQWRKDDIAILGATNTTLFLTNVNTNDAGYYDVVVSNAIGTVTSTAGVLQVLPYGAPSIHINGRLAAAMTFSASPALVTIADGFTNGLIFYTLDGTTPNIGSAFYIGPFSLSNNTALLAVSFSVDFTLSSVAPAVTVIFVPSYNLATAAIGTGMIGVDPSISPYLSNSVVTLTALPSLGYAFNHWSGDLAGSANPATVTMNGPRSVEAVFTRASYPLAMSTAGGGTVSANGLVIQQNTYYPTGALVSLAASAQSGWSFLRWEGSVSSTNNPLLLFMNQTNIVQGIFGTEVRTVVAGSGAILLNPGNPVPYGTVVTATAVPTPSYSFVTWSGAASGNGNPATFTVTNPTPTIGAVFTGPPVPVILTQPTNTTGLQGQSTALIVTANGATPLSYQWRKETNAIAQATNAVFTIFNVVPAQAGHYDVVISNVYGSVTSLVAVLTVVVPPSIVVEPVSQVVASGDMAALSVVADGTEPLRYQWQNDAGFLPDATNATYILNPALTNNSGNYTVVVTNLYGAATSQVATLTVYIPVTITSQPAQQVVPFRGMASFSVLANGHPTPSYQWLFNDGFLTGANDRSLVITNVGTNALGGYSVIAWNAYSAATSSVAMLLMSPSIRTPFLGATVIWGKPATLSASAVGSGELSYQWFKDGAPILWGTNSTLEFSAVQIGDAGLYSVVVSSVWGSATNTPAQLVVNPANISLAMYAGITIDGVTGYTYGIQYSTDLRNTNAWVTITNVTLSVPVETWIDLQSTGKVKRFYRVTAP